MTSPAYFEIVDFIASNNPEAVIQFRPSPEAQQRLADVVEREKNGWSLRGGEGGTGSLHGTRAHHENGTGSDIASVDSRIGRTESAVGLGAREGSAGL